MKLVENIYIPKFEYNNSVNNTNTTHIVDRAGGTQSLNNLVLYLQTDIFNTFNLNVQTPERVAKANEFYPGLMHEVTMELKGKLHSIRGQDIISHGVHFDFSFDNNMLEKCNSYSETGQYVPAVTAWFLSQGLLKQIYNHDFISKHIKSGIEQIIDIPYESVKEKLNDPRHFRL